MAAGIPARQLRLLNAHRAQLSRLRAATEAEAKRYFAELGSWRDSDIPRFVERIVPIVERSEALAVRLRSAVVGRLLGTATPELDIKSFTGSAVRNGTTPETVYTRPFAQLWQGLAEGKPLSTAVTESAVRAGTLANTDVLLASRLASVGTAEAINSDSRTSARVTAWQRVPSGNACDFCNLASTQRYLTGDLQPLHVPYCTCEVLPLQNDPGVQVINPDLLYKLRAETVEVKRSDGSVYIYGEAATPNSDWFDKVSPEVRKEVDAKAQELPEGTPPPSVAIKEHGEYGPVLVNPENNFTGPEDIPD